MGKMKEIAVERAQMEFTKDARELAEATLRLVKSTRDLIDPQTAPITRAGLGLLCITLEDTEDQAKAILAKTVGA